MGAVQGEVGMRYRLTETRGVGAAFLTGGAGYAYVEGSPKCATVGDARLELCRRPSFQGPALTLAGEWRF